MPKQAKTDLPGEVHAAVIYRLTEILQRLGWSRETLAKPTISRVLPLRRAPECPLSDSSGQ